MHMQVYYTTYTPWPYHLFILGQHEVVCRERDTEDNGRDSLEAVDPFLPLRPLSTHVKHPVRPQLGTGYLEGYHSNLYIIYRYHHDNKFDTASTIQYIL